MDARVSWAGLRETFVSVVREQFAAWMTAEQAGAGQQLQFAISRLDEGISLLQYFEARGTIDASRPFRVLDLGAGNGGVAFAFANCRNARVTTLDIVPNIHLTALRRALSVPLQPVSGDGAVLPFHDKAFDIVLLLDTIEHVAQPRQVASEVMRVLRGGGVCVLTTPARLRHLFVRDPHYGVPGLALFPNGLQRFIVNEVLRRRARTPSGEVVRSYDVTHLYWTAGGIVRLFPKPSSVDVLYNRGFTPPGRFTIEWIRHPHWAFEQLRYAMRAFLFDRILIWK